MSDRVIDGCGPGERLTTSVRVSTSYTGSEVGIPVLVWRGASDGPTVSITAAVHGDEINGTGVIRHILRHTPFELTSGTLVLVPVVNLQGFERHTRYLPDRRDLNRSFPGSETGSMAGRLASAVFEQIIRPSDYCIDLHTAAVRRTNFPNVRADMTNERLAPFARAFGSELIVSGAGPQGSLRATAMEAGCATLILEAGEVWKVEPTVLEFAVRGITNCLRYLGMVEGDPIEPAFRIETDSTKWVRAATGGFLEFHVRPGDIVEQGDPIATNTDLLGTTHNVIQAPQNGIVLGMTTLPSVAPGDPVCHLAYPKQASLKKAERIVEAMDDDALHERVRGALASNLRVTDADDGRDLDGADQPPS